MLPAVLKQTLKYVDIFVLWNARHFLSAKRIILLVHYVALPKYILVDSNISNLYFSG